jgi:4-hydroxy-2-oxoglutarate aldolase
MKTTLDGIFLPLTTPFEGDALLLDEFTENIRMYESFEPTGYLVPGTTGESVSLSDEEAVLLIETARATSPDRTLIAGASRESTRDTVEACKAVADGSPVPVLLYNIPSHSGTVLDGGLVLSLLRHPNVAGVKDSSGSLTLLGEVAPDLESRHTFLMGAGSVLLPGLLLGARGGILALADAAPAQCIALYNLYRDGRLEEALGLQRGLTALDKAITRTYGIAGLKHALDLLGFHGGPPREPLLPLNDAGRADLAVLLRKLGLLR